MRTLLLRSVTFARAAQRAACSVVQRPAINYRLASAAGHHARKSLLLKCSSPAVSQRMCSLAGSSHT